MKKQIACLCLWTKYKTKTSANRNYVTAVSSPPTDYNKRLHIFILNTKKQISIISLPSTTCLPSDMRGRSTQTWRQKIPLYSSGMKGAVLCWEVGLVGSGVQQAQINMFHYGLLWMISQHSALLQDFTFKPNQECISGYLQTPRQRTPPREYQ